MTKKNLLLVLSALILSTIVLVFTPKQAFASEDPKLYIRKSDGSPAVSEVDYWLSDGPFSKLFLVSDNLTVDMTNCKPIRLSLILSSTCNKVTFKNLNIVGQNTPYNPYAFDFSSGDKNIRLEGNNIFTFSGNGLANFGEYTSTFTGSGKLSLFTSDWYAPLISYDDNGKIIAGKILASLETNAPESECTEMSFDQVTMKYNTCYIYGNGK